MSTPWKYFTGTLSLINSIKPYIHIILWDLIILKFAVQGPSFKVSRHHAVKINPSSVLLVFEVADYVCLKHLGDYTSSLNVTRCLKLFVFRRNLRIEAVKSKLLSVLLS